MKFQGDQFFNLGFSRAEKRQRVGDCRDFTLTYLFLREAISDCILGRRNSILDPSSTNPLRSGNVTIQFLKAIF